MTAALTPSALAHDRRLGVTLMLSLPRALMSRSGLAKGYFDAGLFWETTIARSMSILCSKDDAKQPHRCCLRAV